MEAANELRKLAFEVEGLLDAGGVGQGGVDHIGQTVFNYKSCLLLEEGHVGVGIVNLPVCENSILIVYREIKNLGYLWVLYQFESRVLEVLNDHLVICINGNRTFGSIPVDIRRCWVVSLVLLMEFHCIEWWYVVSHLLVLSSIVFVIDIAPWQEASAPPLRLVDASQVVSVQNCSLINVLHWPHYGECDSLWIICFAIWAVDQWRHFGVWRVGVRNSAANFVIDVKGGLLVHLTWLNEPVGASYSPHFVHCCKNPLFSSSEA